MPLDLSTFDFEEQAVRVIMRDGAPWFVAADVCRVLEIANSRDAVSRLDDDERDEVNPMSLNVGDSDDQTKHRGGARRMLIVSESGLFALVLTSNKPAARRFRKWITSEVIPAIRRTGQYRHSDIGSDRDPFADLDDLTARTQIAWLQMVREARILGGANAGKRLWAKSPLPRWDDEEPEISMSDWPLRDFLHSCCEVTGRHDDVIRASALYAAFRAWCANEGLPGPTETGFYKQLRALSRTYRASGGGARFHFMKASVIFYRGLKWRETPDPEAAD